MIDMETIGVQIITMIGVIAVQDIFLAVGMAKIKDTIDTLTFHLLILLL